jgi:hypothetical protein
VSGATRRDSLGTRYDCSVRHVVLSALLLTGCDSLFGLTHLHDRGSGADDDAAVDSAMVDTKLVDALPDSPPDAYVQKTCTQLGYATQISGSTTFYRNSGGIQKTWIAAELDCEDDSSISNLVRTHLVVLSSDVEASNVYSGVLFSAAPGGFWIGLTDRIASGNFKWVTSEPTGYPPAATGSPWAPGQSSNGAGEDCVVDSSQVTMDDVPCTEPHYYACECDSFDPKPGNY